MNKRTTNLLAGGLAILAILASAGVAFFVYRQAPHIEDEFAYLWQAAVMAQGKLSLPSPVEPKSQLVPFVVDFAGQRFGKYPPGWPALLSLGVRLGVPGLVNPLLAGAALWLLYRLARGLVDARTGLLAALLLLTSPVFLMLAGSLMAHLWSLVLALVFCLAWFELFLWKETHAASQAGWIRAAAAGGALGMLLITRPVTAVAVALPFFTHGLLLLAKGSRPERRKVLVVGLTAVVFMVLLPLWNGALSGNPWQNLYRLWWPYDRYGFGPGAGVTESGHSLQLAWWNTRHSLESGAGDLFGWFSVSWILLPFGLWSLRRSRASWMLLGSAFSLVLVYGGYWVGSWLYGPRYYFEGMAAACVLTAAGVLWLAGCHTGAESNTGQAAAVRTAGGKPQCHALRSRLVWSLLALLVCVNVFGYLPARLRQAGAINGMSADSSWLADRLGDEPALVFVKTQDSWWEYGLYVPLAPPFSDRQLQVALDRSPAANAAVAGAYPGWQVYHIDVDGRLLEGMP